MVTHERLSPIILLVSDILCRSHVGRGLVTQQIIAVAEGVSIMTGLIIDHIGSQCRQDHMAVVCLQIVKDFSDTMRLQSQENG